MAKHSLASFLVALLSRAIGSSAWMPTHITYSSRRNCQTKASVWRNSERSSDAASDTCSRRQWLVVSTTSAMLLPTFIASKPSAAAPNKSLSEEYRQGTAALADMDDQAPVPREAYVKLPSGLIYADIRTGSPTSSEAKLGSRCNIQWVLRKSNGYFVDSSQVQGDAPFIFKLGDGSAIAGVDEGIRGMREGGVRRLLIPLSLAYVQGLEDGLPGPLPQGFGPRQQMRRVQTVRRDVPGEYIYLEVQLTRVR
ncbi:hypothetical protein MPSEU_000881400 [Mayamaea pseudoterrestris]|nr:hypothetical protein MPSEU_000881400 [Mayamaea pseudoterrestris]